VDDDPRLLKSIERDLKKQYGNLFHILLADSGHQGLKIIEQIKLRNEVVVLCCMILKISDFAMKIFNLQRYCSAVNLFIVVKVEIKSFTI